MMEGEMGEGNKVRGVSIGEVRRGASTGGRSWEKMTGEGWNKGWKGKGRGGFNDLMNFLIDYETVVCKHAAPTLTNFFILIVISTIIKNCFKSYSNC